MVLTSVGKRFVYVSILFMVLSMVLPWESLSDYTYLESAGIMMNIIPLIAFLVAAFTVIFRVSSKYTFPLLCLMNGVIFYMILPFFGLTIAIVLIIIATTVLFKPFSKFLITFGANIIFILLCLTNGIVLYLGMQYYPDTYTMGYILFPSSVIAFMLGAVFSVNRINGLQN